MKEQIFEIIDREVEKKFGPDMHIGMHFDEVLTHDVRHDIFFLIEDYLVDFFGCNHEQIFDEIIVPGIEKMYRDERLDEFLEDLRYEHVYERDMRETQKHLIPGLV